jgi:hypothetical protein
MREKLIAGLAVVLLAACSDATAGDGLAGPDVASAPALSAGAGVTGSVTGNAHFPFQPFVDQGLPPGLSLRRLAFTGREYQDGTVSGEWQIVIGGTILHGNIDCLTILPDGKTGRVSGIVEQAKFTTFQVGTAFAMEFVDNGQGLAAADDAVTEILAFRNAPPEIGRHFCETGEAPGDLEWIEIAQGNFQVRTN